MDFKLGPLSGQLRMMEACPMSSNCQEVYMCLTHHQGNCHPNIGLRQLQETNHGVRLITMKSGYIGTVDRGSKPQSHPSKQGTQFLPKNSVNTEPSVNRFHVVTVRSCHVPPCPLERDLHQSLATILMASISLTPSMRLTRKTGLKHRGNSPKRSSMALQ